MFKNSFYFVITMLLLTSCDPFVRRGDYTGSVPTDREFYTQTMNHGDIPNWYRDDWSEVVAPFTRSCKAFLKMSPSKKISTSYVKVSVGDMQNVCNKWKRGRYHEASSSSIRKFFESNFEAKKIYSRGKPTGTITGYYEPYMKGTKFPTCNTLTPVYGLPFKADHRNYTRANIETGVLTDKAPVIYWVEDPVDYFIMQIQGGGVILDEERGQTRLAYAGNNSHKFKGVGEILKKKGVPLKDWSMNGMKKWLKSNPEAAKKYMRENPRYIYYTEVQSPGPIGTMGIPLSSGRSLAIDRKYYPLGLPMWIDFKTVDKKSISKMAFSQDTGSAIKGSIRADYFWGTGSAAFAEAGRTHAQGSLYLLLPR